ncbi:MAG: CSLREA domain-containing protein [Acidobacteriota bacterium]|nr:CSLREA domain-containing protein [Acidobacteriota bacterium]
MKNDFAPSGFFRPRVLVGSGFCLIGLFFALLSFGALDVGIGSFGGTDVNLITGAETSPNVTQDEGAVWGHGNTVVVVYNDSSGAGLSPRSYCGVSTSTDGGNTFTRLSYKFNTVGECLGSPSLLYSVRAAKWFATFLAPRCGGQGMGVWTSPDGINWSNGGCAASSTSVGYSSLWVDNNPASPFYGRQYVLFDNFNVGNGAVQVATSNDDGLTWSAPFTFSSSSFRRAVKVTGSLNADGTVFAETMDEGGGGLGTQRQNFIFRSTDGGVSWSPPIAQGPSFLGPGRSGGCYFPGMYNTPVPCYWREMGWGELSVGPAGVVHYAYTAGSAGDPGNIFYVRSVDNGLTWSAPLRLNTDATTRAQWSPSVSVNVQGKVFVSWYDERNTTDDSLQRYGRASLDNGATWGTEMPLSDVIFPKPLQPDPLVQSTYVGLYNRTAFSNDGNGNVAYHVWTDGRVSINGSPQQDVFFHKVDLPNPPLIVTTTDDHDDGTCNAADCTLREAINAANSRVGDDVIAFAPGVTGTIQLASALPNLTSNIALQGPGANVLTVRRNSAASYRIFTINAGAIVTISGLTIANGNTFQSGGGILNSGTLGLNGVAISGNHGGNGGGIYNSFGTLTLNQSTISGNSVSSSFAFSGGGIYNQGGNVTITSSTISGNTANGPGGNSDSGGGIITNVGVVTFINSTISGNAADFGGGAWNLNGGTVRSINTIIARNNAPSGPDFDGALTSQGHNFIGNNAAASITPMTGDQIGTPGAPLDPLLGSLQNNGGPTDTLALSSASTAIDAGDDTIAPIRDQRGFLRVGVSDIGAFEFGGAPAPVPLVGAASTKTHGGAGGFAVPLPLSGTPGIECRSGGANNAHTIVFTFANTLTSVGGATLSSGTGTVSAAAIGADAHQYLVDLTGVANAQTITLTLTNVSDSLGNNSATLSVAMGVLLGDTTGDGFVNGGDALQTRNRSGQATDATNFRSDVNVDGFVNSGDSVIVRSRSGTALP